jgi:hypothetical protein
LPTSSPGGTPATNFPSSLVLFGVVVGLIYGVPYLVDRLQLIEVDACTGNTSAMDDSCLGPMTADALPLQALEFSLLASY